MDIPTKLNTPLSDICNAARNIAEFIILHNAKTPDTSGPLGRIKFLAVLFSVFKRQYAGSLTSTNTLKTNCCQELILQKHKNSSYLVEIPKIFYFPIKKQK